MGTSTALAPPRPNDPSPSWGTTLGRFAWPAAFVAVAAMGFGYFQPPVAPTSSLRVDHPSVGVVKEMRALARLETYTMRVEKVIELTDHQKRLRGWVTADDALLFVAAGEVVLGVDLGKLGEGDVSVDPGTNVAKVTLPLPEILSTHFDEARSYVHARRTDVLAQRNEALEASARKEALVAFVAAGKESSVVVAAKAQAEGQLRALARAWGLTDLVVTWAEPGIVGRGEVATTPPPP